MLNQVLTRADAARHLAFVHEPRKLPVVLSREEVAPLRGATSASMVFNRTRPVGRLSSRDTAEDVYANSINVQSSRRLKRECQRNIEGTCGTAAQIIL
jgi:hypothetical protein